jgi:hypothetical protein
VQLSESSSTSNKNKEMPRKKFTVYSLDQDGAPNYCLLKDSDYDQDGAPKRSAFQKKKVDKPTKQTASNFIQYKLILSKKPNNLLMNQCKIRVEVWNWN